MASSGGMVGKNVIVKYFPRWTQNDPTLLFSVGEGSLDFLVRLLEVLAAGTTKDIALKRLQNFVVYSQKEIWLSVGETDIGLIEKIDAFRWIVSMSTWKVFSEMIQSFRASTPGHYYLDPDGPSARTSINVEVSNLEYPDNWWAWRETDEPWTFFGIWSLRDSQIVENLLKSQGIDYYLVHDFGTEESLRENFAWDERATVPNEINYFWIFDLHLEKIGNILRETFPERKYIE